MSKEESINNYKIDEEKRIDMSENKNGFLDVAVVLAAAILYVKTAEVLSYFAPETLNAIIGFDVSAIYGAVCAIIVEGGALYLHFNKRAKMSASAQFTKWAFLAISGACQVFDGFIVTDTLSRQSGTVRFVFQYGVPLIPLIVVIMIFGVGNLPEEHTQRKQYKGMKSFFESLPKIWYGEDYKPTPNAKKTNPTQPTKPQP